MDLLSRDDFREGVFARDGRRCVLCGDPAQDAHHIMERRLFPDGGYYLDNGVSVCGPCHLACESTEVTCEQVREAAGIETVVLPPHLYPDTRYDKWGNPYTEDGKRLKGELFYDESVRRVIGPARIYLDFIDRVKYPRTYHLPWSPTPAPDDRRMPDCSALEGLNVVVTLKMDGENTTMGYDYIHARSVNSGGHPSRDWVTNFWAEHVAYQIPASFRVCGENLYAQHSIRYESLPSYFLGFGVWDHDTLVSWDDTLDYLHLLGISPVPELYRGPFDRELIESIRINTEHQEGYVLRSAGRVKLRDWSTLVGKWVRPDHVQTVKHWMHGQPIVPNNLAPNP